MSLRIPTTLLFAWGVLCIASLARGQQQCYYGAGAQGPTNLVPCNSTGASACCLLGDTCLSGNACYDPVVGNVYQYGCTDVTFRDESCPYKCGFDPAKSPWIAMEYCSDIQDLSNTWVCHGPESCGCEWQSTYDMLVLQPRGCKEMGDEALVALYAPSTLAPYVSLPSDYGGSTGYYSIGTDGSWAPTAVPRYTPAEFTQFTTYRAAPTTSVWIDKNASPGPATYAPASSFSGPAPIPTNTPSRNASQSDSNASGTTTSSTTPTSTTPTTSESPSATNTTAPSSGLSTGAKAGIGVGAGLGAIVIAGLIGALCMMQRRHKRQAQKPQVSQPPPQPPEMQMQSYSSPPPQQQSPHWLPPTPGSGTTAVKDRYYAFPPQQNLPYDLSAQQKPPETWIPPPPPTELSADAGHTVHEMESVASTGLSPETSTTSSPAVNAPRLGQAL